MRNWNKFKLHSDSVSIESHMFMFMSVESVSQMFIGKKWEEKCAKVFLRVLHNYSLKRQSYWTGTYIEIIKVC